MLLKRLLRKSVSVPLTLLAALGLYGCSKKLSTEEIDQLYANGLPPKNGSLNVYHLGHSLVGQDMPFMLKQLASGDHDFRSQLGWGSTLQSHWEPDIPVSGFAEENDHVYYRDVFEAIDSREYDAFVMTEMVEIKAAIDYFDSAKYLGKFAEKLKNTSPDTRVYLYETWHEVTDPAGWINRLDNDLGQYWEGQILHKALAQLDAQVPIYLIPAGQVLSAFFKEVERLGGIDGIAKPEDIFARKEDGSLDPIHINDIGSYFIAVIHYAVLYQKSPEGLPYQLNKANGDAAVAPSAEAAALFQKITWETVSRYPKTGISTTN